MRRLLVVSCALLGLGGCGLLDRLPEPTPASQDIPVAYRSLTADGHQMRRVVVLPFVDAIRAPDQIQMIEDAFVASLRKHQYFEVVTVHESPLLSEAEQDVFRSGVFQKKTLLAMAERYRADGVLFGIVTHFRPYEPPCLGLKVELVSVGAGDVVWSAKGLFDAGDERTAMDVHNYHDVRLASSSSLEGWRRMLTSPRRYTRYVCDRMVDTF